MLIGIDASRANKGKKTGTEWYAYQIINNLKLIDRVNQYVLYTRESLPARPAELPDNFSTKVLHWPLVFIWTHLRLSWEMVINPPDILFVPAHSVPLIHRGRTVVTIHDLGFLHNPQIYHPLARIYHRFSAWWSVRYAFKIITISEFTKQDIIKNYKVNPDKISVIPLGLDKSKYKIITDKNRLKQVQDKYNLTRPYFFYIGRLEKKKNIEFLINAFNQLAVDYPDYDLVLAGSLSYGGDKIMRLIKASSKVKHLGYIEEEDVPPLLNAAQAFVFPSLFEGFGLPIIQAMACGCPVISSNATSLPEVGGKAAWYINPNNRDELIALMKKMAINNEARQQLIDAGLNRAKQFDWQQVAVKTLAVLLS